MYKTDKTTYGLMTDWGLMTHIHIPISIVLILHNTHILAHIPPETILP